MKIAYSPEKGDYVNVATGEVVPDADDRVDVWWGCGYAHPVSDDLENCSVVACHGVALKGRG